jgi:hypothetical protein
MKKIIWISFASIALFIASCSDETVEPTVDPRDKFTGDWLCQETITGQQPQTFTISISKLGSGDSVKISNFSNYGTSSPQTIAEIDDNSIVISSQNITSTGITVQGSGLYSKSGGEKINLSYTTDGDNATAVCTPKP